mmetsp:Transcript_74836/g.200629  ORF Transcript_74836/g.200629 Transcript_74836/m.200629 type:complete len:96 (+) Transcript_74836:3682-3969(+)
MPVMWYGCVVADLRRAAREALYLEPESGFGVGVIIFDNVQKVTRFLTEIENHFVRKRAFLNSSQRQSRPLPTLTSFQHVFRTTIPCAVEKVDSCP